MADEPPGARARWARGQRRRPGLIRRRDLLSRQVTDPLESLAEGTQEILGRPLTKRERELFCKYLELLIKWKKSQRLIGSAAPHWIVENLFLDSLLFLKVFPSPPSTLLDLGAGAGFPYIPLKSVLGYVELVLVESRQKLVSFLSIAVWRRNLSYGGVVSFTGP